MKQANLAWFSNTFLVALVTWKKLLLLLFLMWTAAAASLGYTRSCDYNIATANVQLNRINELSCLSKCCQKTCLFMAASENDCDTAWITSNTLPATHNLYTNTLSACQGVEQFADWTTTEVSQLLTASSTMTHSTNDYGPTRSRLHTQKTGGLIGAWAPVAPHTYGEYIQADMQELKIITAVATQGRQDYPEWVTEYHFNFSRDGTTWWNYNTHFNIANFTGNSDRNTVVKHDLPQPIVARLVRVVPTKWYVEIGLRWEVYGCSVH